MPRSRDRALYIPEPPSTASPAREPDRHMVDASCGTEQDHPISALSLVVALAIGYSRQMLSSGWAPPVSAQAEPDRVQKPTVIDRSGIIPPQKPRKPSAVDRKPTAVERSGIIPPQ